MAAAEQVLANVRASLSDDCLVLLEELIKSNKALVEENKRLREEHEKNTKSNTEVLKRIELSLESHQHNSEAGKRKGRFHRRRSTRIVVPAACRRSVRKMYHVLNRKEDFHGFYLDELVSSENNQILMDRVISQVFSMNGGEERCPWTRAICEAALQRYFQSCYETSRLKSSSKYEEHKKKTRKSGRQREKLTRRTEALEMIQWKDNHEKGRVAEILCLDAMSSEESCYEDEQNGSKKAVKYQVKKLAWESRPLKKIKKKLDKAYKKRMTKRAKDRILERVQASEPSERQPPSNFPEWALNEVAAFTEQD